MTESGIEHMPCHVLAAKRANVKNVVKNVVKESVYNMRMDFKHILPS